MFILKNIKIRLLTIILLIFSFSVIQFVIIAKSHLHITPDGEIIAHFHPTEEDDHEENDESHNQHSHSRQEYVAYSALQKMEFIKTYFVFYSAVLPQNNSFIAPETPQLKSFYLSTPISLRAPPLS
jgi:Na+/H+ antiporter NhaA